MTASQATAASTVVSRGMEAPRIPFLAPRATSEPAQSPPSDAILAALAKRNRDATNEDSDEEENLRGFGQGLFRAEARASPSK